MYRGHHAREQLAYQDAYASYIQEAWRWRPRRAASPQQSCCSPLASAWSRLLSQLGERESYHDGDTPRDEDPDDEADSEGVDRVPRGLICGIRQRPLRTLLASTILQCFGLAFVLLYTPWSDWKVRVPQASVALAKHGAMVAGALGALLYVCDIIPPRERPKQGRGAAGDDRWRSCVGALNWAFGAALLGVTLLFAVAESRIYPAVVSAMTLLAMPLLAAVLQRTVLRGRLATNVLALVSMNCSVTAVWAIVGWLMWVHAGNRWVDENRRLWATRLGCDVEDGECRRHAYIMWISGAVLAFVSVFFAVASGLLARSTARVPLWAMATLGFRMEHAFATERARRRQQQQEQEQGQQQYALAPAGAMDVAAMEAVAAKTEAMARDSGSASSIVVSVALYALEASRLRQHAERVSAPTHGARSPRPTQALTSTPFTPSHFPSPHARAMPATAAPRLSGCS